MKEGAGARKERLGMRGSSEKEQERGSREEIRFRKEVAGMREKEREIREVGAGTRKEVAGELKLVEQGLRKKEQASGTEVVGMKEQRKGSR